MINVTEKKKLVRELVLQSSLCKLMGKQEGFLKYLDGLPDEITEEDLPVLNGLQAIIEASESDSDMKETLDMFLRLDEMGRRRVADPNAPIDDLLMPIEVKPVL